MNRYGNAGISLYTGKRLSELLSNSLENIKDTRNPFKYLVDYLVNVDRNNSFRVCILNGIRRTGKTTMMHQAIMQLLENNISPKMIAYIAVNMEIDIDEFKDYILTVIDEYSLDYIFLDGITKVRDLAEYSQWLSDWVASKGKRVVITGSDSLALHFLEIQGLNTKYVEVPVPPLSYSEHARLIGNTDVLEYTRTGGIFTNELSSYSLVRDFVYQAISANIVRSIEKNNNRALGEWLDKIPAVVSKIIHENVRLMVLRAISAAFAPRIYSDVRNTGNEVSLKLGSKEAIVNAINSAMPVDDTANISGTELNIVYNYLLNMGLIQRVSDFEAVKVADIITMPGLIYAYGRHIVANLRVGDFVYPESGIVTENLTTKVRNKILEQLERDILANVILLANYRKYVSELDLSNRVCFYRGDNSVEIDMLTILNGDCQMYEIRRENTVTTEQRRWLIDAAVNQDIGLRTDIVSRNVLYNGTDCLVQIGSEDRKIKEQDKNRLKTRFLDAGEEVAHGLYSDNISINYWNTANYLRKFD